MKIAVSGVHGIGKTTDVQRIGEEFNLEILPEQARYLLNTEYPFQEVDSNLSVFMDFQTEVLNRQVKLLEENQYNNFVTDRTPIDSLAYVVERLGAERFCYSKYFEDYFNKAFDAMKMIEFDKIFFINFSTKSEIFWKRKEADGNRNLSVMYMKSLNEVMGSLYLSGIQKFSVYSISSEYNSAERFEKIKRILDD